MVPTLFGFRELERYSQDFDKDDLGFCVAIRFIVVKNGQLYL